METLEIWRKHDLEAPEFLNPTPGGPLLEALGCELTVIEVISTHPATLDPPEPGT